MEEKKRDTFRTTQAVLDAAGVEFAAHGFEGARMDAIADAAGVNKATIYYHIGNKRKLYTQVIVGIISGLTDDLEIKIKESTDPEEQLKVYVQSVASAIFQREHLAQILVREFAAEGQNMPEEIAQDFKRLVKLVEGILKRGHRAGRFVETSPFVLHFMVVGCSLLYRISEPMRQRLPLLKHLVIGMGFPDVQAMASELEQRILRSVLVDRDHYVSGGNR